MKNIIEKEKMRHILALKLLPSFLMEELAVRNTEGTRVVYKSRQPAKFAGFSARFCQLLSLLHESKYVEEMDPQPSTFHKTPAT